MIDNCDEEREELCERYGYPTDVVAGLAPSVADNLVCQHMVAEAYSKLSPFMASRYARKIAATYDRKAVRRASAEVTASVRQLVDVLEQSPR